MGEVRYRERRIEIATNSTLSGRSYKREEINDTFWHELTHAILFEMNHPYWNNEKFVTKFANYLTKAIDTAEF